MYRDQIIEALRRAGLQNEVLEESGMEWVVAGDVQGVPVTVALTDESPNRLRMAATVCPVSEIDGVPAGHPDDDDPVALVEILDALLDLNTEIDPVAVWIAHVAPENPTLQARTTLRVVDLQAAEVEAALSGLMGSLGEIRQTLVAYAPAVAQAGNA